MIEFVATFPIPEGSLNTDLSDKSSGALTIKHPNALCNLENY